MQRVVGFVFLIVVFCSCQEVINVDLNSASPRLVVEGDITTKPGPYLFKLSRTTNFFDNNIFAPEVGASVIINDNAGSIDTLKEILSGIYVTKKISGTIGNTYNLSIYTQGQKYSASAKMMDTVHIDSLTYTLGTGKNPQYRLACAFQDPLGIGNYYAFRTYKNRAILGDVVNNRIVTDKITNGGWFRNTFRNDAIQLSDTIKVELLSVDKATYDYYNTLRATLNSGSPFSTPPANPVTNLSNGALGFFGAYAVTSRSVVIN